MKVLIVIPALKRAGAERIAAMLSRQFAAAHETQILVFNSSDIAYQFGGTLIDVDLEPASKAGKFFNVLRRSLAIRKHLRSFRPDLILSFGESANFPTVIAATLAGYRKRTHVSVRIDLEFLPWYIRLVGALLYRLPASVVGCSAGVSGSVRRLMCLGSKRVRTIVNPVEVRGLDRTAAAPCLPAYLTERPYFVAVGRLDRQKGFDVLLSAWRRSRLAGSHNLVILGDGSLRDELPRLSESLGLGGSVHFPGAVDDPFPIVRGAVGFVLSSRFEGWPNALAEAMALGVPVIATDCKSGPSELIRNPGEGLLVPVEDSEALSRAMLLLSQDEPLRQRLGAAAQARTAELSPKRIADEWLVLAGDGAGVAPNRSTARTCSGRSASSSLTQSHAA